MGLTLSRCGRTNLTAALVTGHGPPLWSGLRRPLEFPEAPSRLQKLKGKAFRAAAYVGAAGAAYGVVHHLTNSNMTPILFNQLLEAVAFIRR
jgi:hypothetical protein